MEGKALIMDEKAMSRAINRISYEIIERNKGSEDSASSGSTPAALNSPSGSPVKSSR